MTNSPSPKGAPTTTLKRAHPAQVLQDREITAESESVDVSQEVGPANGQADNQKPLTGEVLVDYDGTPRRVKIEDIVAKARAAENAEAIEAAANAALAKAGAATQIANVYATLSEERKRALEAVLRNTELLDRIHQPQQRQDQDFVFEGQQKPAPDPRVDLLHEVVTKQIMPVLAGIGQERLEQSVKQQVDAAMAEWPVFQQDEVLAEMAKTNILNRKALNPESKVSEIVAQTATQVAQLLQRRRASGQIVGQASKGPTGGVQHPRFTAKDLQSGAISRYLRDQAGLI